MLSSKARPRCGWLLAVATFLVASLLALPQSAQANSVCTDYEGTPSVFSIDAGTSISILLGGSAVISDIDVALRLRADRTADLEIDLKHTVSSGEGEPDETAIYLLYFDGCSVGKGYDPATLKDSDLAVYLDDQAQGSVSSACDRTIPSVSGRLQPSPVLHPLKDKSSLQTFAGRGPGSWTLSIGNRPGTPANTVVVDDICLILEGILEGDVSPREYTPGLGGAFSGNSILTISDYIDSALFLLDFNHIDQRVHDKPSTSPLPDDLATIVDGNLEQSLIESSSAEYTRLDTAPASSGGNGSITVADWVQATRYATGTGFDDPVAASGPLSEFDRIIRLGKRNERVLVRRGLSEVAVPVYLRSKGVEREIAFGFQFDDTLLEFVKAERGAAVPPNANFQLNNQIGGLPNKIGLQIGLLPSQTFPTTLDGTTPTDFTQNIDADLEIAKIYFRAKPGTGAAATEITFIMDPLIFNAPSVRNPGGLIQYTSFVSGEVTIINNADPRPHVRVQDTVINSGGTGNVSILLDSVGIENAAGFTVNFNPAELTLTKVERGRDLPFSGFFFTGPDYVIDLPAANDDGKLRVLTALQPGLSYEAGSSNEIVKLTFDAAVQASTITSAITLTPLYDTKEVTDPNAIPLVTDFVDGAVRVSEDACGYSLSSTGATFSPLGTLALPSQPSFDVTTNISSCPWVATTDVDWITIITEGIFSGNQTVVYSVDANTSPDTRVGLINIAGETFTVTQTGCTFDLSPDTQTFAQQGGNGSFQVVTQGSCAWEAISDATWITLTNNGFGEGIGTVTYSVAPLVGDSRTSTISLVGTSTQFTVTQNRCTYDLTPTESGLISPSGATGLEIELTTSVDCPWTVATAEDWIVIQSEASGVGSTTIIYDVLANVGPDRDGIINVGDRTFAVSQTGTDTCSYEIAPSVLTYSGTGGTGSFTLTTQTGCPWTITAESAWITITSAGTDTVAPFQGTGPVTVNYTVAENSGLARTGTISVGQETPTHSVQQFGGNEFVFEFPENAQGWVFQTVTPTFIAPAGAWNIGTTLLPGRLDVTPSDNTNTFGLWASPDLGLTNAATLEGLYQADFVLSRDSATAQSNVPTVRIRTSSVEFSQSDVFVITANQNGSFSPTPGGKAYTHIFSLPPGTTVFRAFYDLLNFDPTDSPTCRVSLERISLAPVDAARVKNPETVRQYLLASSTSGWTTATAPPYRAPAFSTDTRGLKVGSGFSSPGNPPTTVGFWTRDTGLALTAGKLYKVACTVSSRSEGSGDVRKDQVPTFRVRVNDSSFKLSSYVNIDSVNEDSRVPTFLQNQTYNVWFVAPTEVTGNSLLFSFDYLFTPESNNDPRISLILESVIISTYDLDPPAAP
jgi:hypothetical protein